MRILLPTLAAVTLLAACTGGGTPTTPSSSSSPATGASTAPSTMPASAAPSAAPLNASSRLSVDGQAVQLADSTPKINSGGAIAISNAANGLMDKSYSTSVTLRNQKSGAALMPTFKVEDIDRVEMTIDQVVVGRSSGNRWTGVFDVPNRAIQLTNNAGRLMGTLNVFLAPDQSNEASMKKNVMVKYEFENAIQ